MDEIIGSINAVLESAMVGTILDSLILVVAFAPAIYISAKFLFGNLTNARRLLGSPMLMGWLFFFCGFEILLHLMKVPILLKVVVIILGILLLPIFFIADEVIS